MMYLIVLAAVMLFLWLPWMLSKYPDHETRVEHEEWARKQLNGKTGL